MWVIIYIASMAVLLLGCSVWAMLKRERDAQAAFTGTSMLLIFLLLALSCSNSFYTRETAMLFVVGNFLVVDILLLCHSLICALKQQG